jgi:aminopeptidase YwaD
MLKIIYKNAVVLTVGWCVIILILCATPGHLVPSPTWADLLSIDKLVHAIIFFILCGLLLLVTLKYNAPQALVILVVLASIAYGGLIEILQATCFINRSGNWQDFIADAFGCLIALLTLKRIKLYFL